MIAAAHKNGIDARQASGESLPFEAEFDAVFSNAALHWIRDQDAVLASVKRALRPGGRLVAELGGHGNVAAIRNQLGLSNAENVLQRAYIEAAECNQGIPKAPGIVPALLKQVQPLKEVIPVDYYLPGCPPSAPRIKLFLEQVLAGQAPHLSGADLKFG